MYLAVCLFLLLLPRPETLGVTIGVLGFALASPLLVWAGRRRLGRVRSRRATLPFLEVPLTERLMAAREQERYRLRHDLHDGLGSSLAGIRLRLDSAAARVTHQPSAHRLILDAAAEAERTIDDVRRIIDDLRPLDLDKADLPSALRLLVNRIGTGRKLRVDWQLPEPDQFPRTSRSTELAAYRIASEALTNAVRHAAADTVAVSLDVCGDQLVLEVLDDGIGPPRSGSGHRGVGLASMAQRAEEVGGRCLLLPHPGGPSGTLVHVVLPLDPP